MFDLLWPFNISQVVDVMCNLMIIFEMGIIHENNNISFASMCIMLKK